jgi:catechol 2,3-dioxygenase-like lactoylglutathione lyase family enzyme
MLFTPEAEAVRAFLRDVLGLPAVDAGGGWLIFGLPPAELGVHPAEDEHRHELYLMCDDLEATMDQLRGRGVELEGGVHEEGFGRVTTILLPGGGRLGLYEPRHPTALHLSG